MTNREKDTMFAPVTTPKVGQRFENVDPRNAELYRSGRKKGQPKRFRRVELVTLPTLSRPGVMRVLFDPKQPVKTGEDRLREYTLAKLEQHYVAV